MNSIQMDLEAAAKAVTERLKAKLPPPDERARQDLSNVLDSDLSVQDFIAYATALAQAKSYVAAALGSITVREVLGDIGPKLTRKKPPARTSRTASFTIDLISEALRDVKVKLPKSEILAKVAAKNPNLGKAQLGTLWTTARPSLASEGSGAKTVYGLG